MYLSDSINCNYYIQILYTNFDTEPYIIQFNGSLYYFNSVLWILF